MTLLCPQKFFQPAELYECSSRLVKRDLVGEAPPARDLVIERPTLKLGQIAVARIPNIEAGTGAQRVDVEVAVVARVWADGGDVVLELGTARQAETARGDDVVAVAGEVEVGAEVDTGVRGNGDGVGVEALAGYGGFGIVGGYLGHGGAVGVAVGGRGWHSGGKAEKACNGESGGELHGRCWMR